MESVPEPRPSEWDKRLSTHSPFRTLSVNGQIPSGADGVSTRGQEGAQGQLCHPRSIPSCPQVGCVQGDC